MEDLKALRLKEKILLIELKNLREKIAVYDESLETTVNSVQETERLQTESIPSQTAKGKEKSSPLIPDALGKSILKANDELQSSSSPEANGSGKDTPNPLMADSLPKTGNLRPTYAQRVTSPEYQKSRFYVIFDGEHRGIYEDWAIVSRYVQHSSVPFKKFGSLLQAQQEATKFSAQFGKKEIPLKVTIIPEPIKPRKQERVIEFRNTSKEFSKITSNEEKEEEKDIISLDEFRMIWSKARFLSQNDFDHEHIYTEDKATKSLIIFCPGASPELVSLAFSAGLIKFIYPASNLLEIGSLAEGMKKAIKNFRKKIAAAKDANIFIKCTSTLPDWYQGKSFPAYHHLEIGLAKTRTVNPSKVMDDDEDIERWCSIRAERFITILQNLEKIKTGSFNKVNYYSSNCIITSYSGTPLPLHEWTIVNRFSQRIIDNNVDVGPTTKKLLCQKLTGIIENHECSECKEENDSRQDSISSEEIIKDTRELDPTHGYID